MKHFVKIMFTCICLISVTATVQAKTLKAISGFPTTHMYTKSCMGIFQDNLKAASGDRMDISIMGPDVVPTNEQFQPVQSGVFDLLFTHTAYHMGTTAIGLTLEAVNSDPVKRRESGIIGAIDKEYEKHGMKLLAVLPAVEYNIVLSRPAASTSPSLKGLKIRTPPAGAPMNRRIYTGGGGTQRLQNPRSCKVSGPSEIRLYLLCPVHEPEHIQRIVRRTKNMGQECVC